MNDPDLELYHWGGQPNSYVYLHTIGATLETMTEHKVVYVFLKTNLLLDLEVIYKDKHNIEYVRVPKEIVSTCHFGGLPLCLMA